MPDLSPNARSALTHASRLLVVLLAALVPLLLCAALCRYETGRIARREANLASRFIVNQVSAIVEQGREAARRFVPHAGEPCEQMMPEMAFVVAASPYVRTLNIMEGDHLSCSSVLAKQVIAATHLLNGATQVPRGQWLMLVYKTPIMPNRPSLLIGEPAADARTVVAVVDDRYLLDLLHAAAPLDIFRQVELRFDEGMPLYEAPGAAPLDGSPLLADVSKDVGGGTVELRVYGLESREHNVALGLLARYMPWAAALSVLQVWFVRRLQRSAQSRREQLLRGIRRNEFHVEYQPLYGVVEGRCAGAEALLRWVRPGSGPIRADEFITAAEEEHVIVPLTQHLLKLIALDLATMNVPPAFHLGINFAPEHLSGTDLVADVRGLLAATGARGPRIAVEITERSLMKNTDQARRNLEALRQDGIEVSIDDFGTGYCSLSYLQRFPFDLIKIDRGFVLTIDTEGRNAVVLDSIIDLAHGLGAGLVAEGVETEAQFDYLCARGVAFIQGYLYAKPMTAGAFVSWYRTSGQHAFPAVPAASAQ